MNVDVVEREKAAMRHVTQRLTKDFGARYSPEQISQTIETAHHRFDHKPIRDFVPILVERIARQELRRTPR